MSQVIKCEVCNGDTLARVIDYRINKRWVKTCVDCGYGIFPDEKGIPIDEVEFKKEETDLYVIRGAQVAALVGEVP